MPTYHDVVVYVGGVRYKPADNFALELTCTRVAGWQLWRRDFLNTEPILLGGEYYGTPFCVEVKGRAICGKRPKEIVAPPPFGWTGWVENRDGVPEFKQD